MNDRADAHLSRLGPDRTHGQPAGRRGVRPGGTPGSVPRYATPNAPRVLATLLSMIVALAWLAASSATAQQRFNVLAVDGKTIEAAGPYYFIEQGDSSNAFARAAPLAEALGLDVRYDAEQRLLVFGNGRTTAEWRVSRNVASGLEHRPGTLYVDGAPFGRPVPSAILVDGVSYVAVTPIAEAFGGSASWYASARVIDVTVPAFVPPPSGPVVGTPRIGRHDGYTRVAIDVAAEQPVRLAVAEGALALSLPGARLEAFDRSVADGPLSRIYADEVAGDATLVLVVDHDVAPDGRGYRLGRTEGDVVYVDVGPELQGEPVGGIALGATPPAATAVPRPLPDRRPVVVLDAGHGGHDPGTVSSWAQEKEIVLDVTMRLAELLRSEGIEVVLTRDHDAFLTLQERSTFATTERNVFVSIHANGSTASSARGIETWVFGRPLDPSLIDQAIRENGGGELGEQLTAEAAESADIAGDILRESQLNYSLGLANLVQDRLTQATGANDRGVRQNLFYVIRNSRIPAILIEVGFVSNPDEGRKLLEDAYRETLSVAIADGILDFLSVGGNGGEMARASD